MMVTMVEQSICSHFRMDVNGNSSQMKNLNVEKCLLILSVYLCFLFRLMEYFGCKVQKNVINLILVVIKRLVICSHNKKIWFILLSKSLCVINWDVWF